MIKLLKSLLLKQYKNSIFVPEVITVFEFFYYENSTESKLIYLSIFPAYYQVEGHSIIQLLF